jgi:ketosteroid isomerase-like protein
MRFQAGALATLGLLAVMIHAPSVGQQPASDQAAEVEKLDRELSAAGVRGDVVATARLVADEAVFVQESGKTTTKADLLAFMKSADYKLESENFDDIHSSQFGDTVVLWGRVTSQATYKQKAVHATFDFTDVWQRHNGHWQQVFTRGTPAGKP